MSLDSPADTSARPVTPFTQNWTTPGSWDMCPSEWKNFVYKQRETVGETAEGEFSRHLDTVLREKFSAEITYKRNTNFPHLAKRETIEFSDEGYLLFLLYYK